MFLIKRLDTTFTIPQKKLIANFKNEIAAIKPRMVLLEAEFKIVVNTENFKKKS